MRLIKILASWLALQSLATSARAECLPQDDVLAALRCLPGVTADETTGTVFGYREFELDFEQPVDHGKPDGATFKQRVVLLHKSWDEPMVLQTSGYSIFGVALTQLARTFGANQIQIEHRYFADSVPADLDWSKLDITQSAADFHAITQALKQLYAKRWVNTGASKGGMTSVFHRRFYPNDLDGTVADVAPLSFSQDDPRYVTFVDQAGGDQYSECRAKLEALQLSLLRHRDDLLPRVQGEYTALGGASTSFEHAVIELPFAFWQYQSPTDASVGCAKVPAADAELADQWSFFSSVNDPSGYNDDSMNTFQPYYYQAGTQLGAPAAKLEHLGDLRHHDYSINQYMPEDVDYSYSNTAMRDVESWVKTSATGIMFVYGEFDPWTAGAYPRVEGNDMHWYLVPAANHGAKLFALPAVEKAEALATLARWFDKEPVEVDVEAAAQPTLDQLELEARQRYRLP